MPDDNNNDAVPPVPQLTFSPGDVHTAFDPFLPPREETKAAVAEHDDYEDSPNFPPIFAGGLEPMTRKSAMAAVAQEHHDKGSHPVLHITSLTQYERVPYKLDISGICHDVAIPDQYDPFENDWSPIQVLIRARDGRWYLQAPTTKTDAHWRTIEPTCFGYSDGPTGGSYDVVALVPTERITTSPLQELPPARLQSPITRVRRGK